MVNLAVEANQNPQPEAQNSFEIMLYDALIHCFVLGIRVAAIFSPKARLWLDGRRDWRAHLAKNFQKKGPLLWVHAASLGEFEQGRPLIEAFRARFPDWQVVLTFFSPSGFEIRKNYPHADFICYLPADTRRNAADFADMLRPDAAIFVKYEFWNNHLRALRERGVPTLLVSAVFRAEQPFFKWYGGFWRSMLGCFSHIFVQADSSRSLLQEIGFQNVTVAGDTRIDRVLQIAEARKTNEVVATFLNLSPALAPAENLKFSENSRIVLVCGSTWPADEAILFEALQRPAFSNFKKIVAPHEPSPENVARICAATGGLRYSQFSGGTDWLVVDNVGLLNTLYLYGTVAYIGGGFGRGIHNTLEPAAFGLPVIFGPNFQKFEEARQLLACGGAFSVKNAEELAAVLEKLARPDFREQASEAALGWLRANRGASARILAFLSQILLQKP